MSQQNEELKAADGTKKRQRESNSDPHPPARKSRKLSAEDSPGSENDDEDETPSKPQNKHTKKERKQNRSSRIHSLKKLLARGTLPRTVQQEKERELAALLHEQTKTISKKQVKKTLEKYHYVRFMERRKAEKRLKQLRKQQDAQGESEDLSTKIHNMEVNRNYAIYAPLGEKYASIFVSKAEEAEEASNKSGQRTAGSSRPATWYAVEAAMLKGETALEALRDGKTSPVVPIDSSVEERGQKQDKSSLSKSQSRRSGKKSAHEKDHIERKTGLQVEQDPAASSDSDHSDGGFFQR